MPRSVIMEFAEHVVTQGPRLGQQHFRGEQPRRL
jgi:hypothetical protein